MARKPWGLPDTVLMPPDIGRVGAIAFTSEDRDILAKWLDRPGWPKGSMDLTTLDGYLTALIVWPIALQPGAWLPPIWNETGWRVPAMIRSTESYHQFIALIVGYLQQIDRGLSAALPTYLPTLRARTQVSGHLVRPEAGWATGFQKALTLCAGDVDRRSPAITRAVTTIARMLSPPDRLRASVRDPHTVIMEVVLVFAAERTSHGPLSPPRHRGKSS